jgi:hypothetical protein
MKCLFNYVAKAVFIMTLAMMMTSCSIKFIYNQLDYLIPYYVDGMVTLDDMLEEKIEQRSLMLINWHRHTQLDRYAQWLRDFQRDANDQLTEEKVHRYFATLESYWESVSLRINDEMVLLLPLLNAEQRQELFANLAEKNADFREDYIDLNENERIEQFAERLVDSYETWLGDLTNEQEKTMNQAAAKMQSTAELRLQRRLNWQRSLEKILTSNDNKYDKRAALSNYFTEYNNRDNVAMKTAAEKNKMILAGLTVQTVHSMTDEQKSHFLASTNDYIRLFEDLASNR